MAKYFTVLISSETDIHLNDMGKLLNMIETRGIVIEEIHEDNLIATEYEMEARND
jgi:hypothetical protein